MDHDDDHNRGGPCCLSKLRENARDLRAGMSPAVLAEMDGNHAELKDLARLHGVDPESDAFKVGWYLSVTFMVDALRSAEGPAQQRTSVQGVLLCGLWDELVSLDQAPDRRAD